MNLTIGVLPLISLFDTDNPQTKKLRYEAVKDLIRIPKDVKGELDKLWNSTRGDTGGTDRILTKFWIKMMKTPWEYFGVNKGDGGKIKWLVL